MKTPSKKGRRYVNPYNRYNKRSIFSWLGFCLGMFDDHQRLPKIPDNFNYPQFDEEIHSHLPSVSWINHSTFLIDIDGLRVLTDPIWSDRCSPIKFAGPRRKHPPGCQLEELPKIDYVLISHNHYDHMDKETILKLKELFTNIHWIIPKGMSKWFRRVGIDHVEEYDWWVSNHHKDRQVTITAVPSQHFSGRNLFNFNKTPWNGYVVSFHNLNKTLYFAGDTGYNPIHFKQVGEEFSKIDLSLIPIGAYIPQKFMQPVHISPKEAVHIHRDVRSSLSVGGHHSTFPLSKEGEKQPPFDLFCAVEEAELDHRHFRVLQPGQTINW